MMKNVEEISVTKDDASYSTLKGNYVSADYDKKDEGYDWVGVIVSEADKINLK